MALFHFRNAEININVAEIAEIAESAISEYRNHSTKLDIKIRKPQFKLRKTLFKRCLERNGKNKNVLKFYFKKD